MALRVDARRKEGASQWRCKRSALYRCRTGEPPGAARPRVRCVECQSGSDLEEPLPIRRERANAAVRAVRGDEQRVAPKELGNFHLAVRQVFVEGCARGHAGLLQLDDHQRQAVDEADQIRSAGVERAGDTELADEQGSNVRRNFTILHL